MAYEARPSASSPDIIDVDIPATRADVLHQADIMEDVAIAYGFNNLPRAFPNISGTIGQPLPINKLSDIVRTEAAMAGWSEALPLILCSHDENFAWLNRKDDGNTAVKLSNPKALEFQVVRTSLIPGLLKTIRENKHHTVPMKIFEVSDVAFKDLELERKSRNERHFAAAWYGKTSGFEVVHGLLDRIMAMLKSAFITAEEGLQSTTGSDAQYWIEELNGKSAYAFAWNLFYFFFIFIFIFIFLLIFWCNCRAYLLPWTRCFGAFACGRAATRCRCFRYPTPYSIGEFRAQIPRQHAGD